MERLGCPVARAAARYPQAMALQQGELRLSYTQLGQCIDERVRRLQQAGLLPGQRVAVRADSDWQLLVDFWALLRHGNVVCPVSPRLPPQAARDAAELVDAIGWWPGTDSTRGARKPRVQTTPPHAPGGQPLDLATIIFSSGTTTRPKAVGHDLSAHEASAEGANGNVVLEPGCRCLLSLPWSHVSGLGILFRCALAGATVVISPQRRPLGEDLRQDAITHVSVVPVQLKRLLAQDPTPPQTLRCCLLGGAPLPTSLVLQAHERGWPVHCTYGLTEMASQVTTTRPDAAPSELLTAGRPLAGRQLSIADDGEILVQGRTLFRGYYERPSLRLPLDACGWFHTGDCGRLDASGCLIVAGRRDHMLVSGGENIHPEEIETALLQLAGVQQALVVAVPDPEFGQRPVAFVQSDDFRPDHWRARLSEQLPRFKVPDHFLLWPPQADIVGIKPSRQQLQSLAVQQLT